MRGAIRSGLGQGRSLRVGIAALAATAFLIAYATAGLFPQPPAQQGVAVTAVAKTNLPPPVIPAVGWQIAPTPPMGWNGFNHFYLNVTAATIRAEALALVTSGMKAAGYGYVNVDGGWDMLERDAKGNLQPMRQRFPNGIKPVADYVHSLGLKFGLYASAGYTNCARTSAGSYGHYLQDAAAFASWGVDYLKLDWCAVPYGAYPGFTHAEVSRMLTWQMRDAIGATHRAMVLDANVPAEESPWGWAPELAELWRTAKDSHDRYGSVTLNFHDNVMRYPYAGRGRWNDPDMLEVGNGGMSTEEYKTQFSLWAVMAAPLIAGNDLTAMSRTTLGILTNAGVIAVDQDPLGEQAHPVSSAGGRWVLVKPLANGGVAVVLFNEMNTRAWIAAPVRNLGLPAASAYSARDLWTGRVGQVTSVLGATVAPHAVVMYVVAPAS